ncbi:hypothetical protein BASA83_002260 [Batrachochytrium salamandrivorans]|nr:hypothetical protein BASA83_002260 [Batrachochytrium salamandrivorans]
MVAHWWMVKEIAKQDSFMSTDDDAETAVNDISMASIYLDKSFISTSTESTAHESTFASLVGDDLDADYDNDMEEGDCHYSGNLLPRAFQSLCETSSVLVDSFPPTTQSDSIQPPSLTDLSSSFDSLFDSLGWSGLSETMPDIDDSDFALSSPSAYADIHHDLDDVETFGSHNLSMGDQHNYMGVDTIMSPRARLSRDAGEDPIHEHELPNSLLHSKYHRLDQQLYQRRQYRSRRRNEKLYRPRGHWRSYSPRRPTRHRW